MDLTNLLDALESLNKAHGAYLTYATLQFRQIEDPRWGCDQVSVPSLQTNLQ